VIALAGTLLASCLLAAEPKPITDEVIQKVTAAMPATAPAKPAQPRKLLVFTLAKGSKHGSIPLAAKTFEIMGQKTGAWAATCSDDPAMFKPESLAKFDAVMMDNTTGDLFADENLKKSFVDFVKGGKGLAGCHAATDCFYKWPEYGDMMGGYFAGHLPGKIMISVKLDDPASPINAAFGGKGFEIGDEIYMFKEPYSREKLHILLSIDYENAHFRGDKRADKDYAVSWIRPYGEGRVFYCSLGHNDDIFWNPAILAHYLAGIQYALGDLKADETPSAKLNIAPARGPVIAAQPEKAKAPDAKKGANKANKESIPATQVLKAPLAAAKGGAKAAPKAPLPPFEKPAPTGAKPDAEGWITLFDGKNLDMWQKPAADKWKIVDGVLASEKGCGSLWTRDEFGDFTVDLEYKVEKSSNSGVFLRSPEAERNWLQGAIEIQIASPVEGKVDKHTTGAIYDCLGPSVFAEKPVGEWNHMVITAKGNSIKIELNGKQIIDADLNQWTEAGKNPDGTPNKFKTAYKDLAKVGYLGLQDHGSPIWFRNVKVKALVEAKPSAGG
jgi:hypothetical protein